MSNTVEEIKAITAPCETKWNTKQPYLVMQGFGNEVRIKNKTAVIL